MVLVLLRVSFFAAREEKQILRSGIRSRRWIWNLKSEIWNCGPAAQSLHR